VPFGILNGAAILAILEWEFAPGLVDAEPADVLFNLTVDFKVGM
jgi:hypothetical protein